MARLQPDAQWVYICGKGNDNGRPYVAQIDADGNLITGGATVDAADVTYTPTTAADWDGGVDPGNQDSVNDQLAERVKDIEDIYLSSLLPVRYEHLHINSFVIVGNSLAYADTSVQDLQTIWFQSAAADSDTFMFSCVLAPGSYTLSTTGMTTPASGRCDIDFKHTLDAGYTNIVNQQDWYSAGNVKNVRKTVTFTVTTAGRHIFKYTVDGKHASATDYHLRFSHMQIFLTAGDS